MKYQDLETQIRGHLLFAAIGWGIAVPFMYAILLWSWSNRSVNPDVNWPGLFTIPLLAPVLMLGGMYFVSRSDLKSARERDETEEP